MNIIKLCENDIITLRKNHPCEKKAYDFKVLMVGSDIKIQCVKCLRTVIVPRIKLEKNIRLINTEPPHKSAFGTDGK